MGMRSGPSQQVVDVSDGIVVFLLHHSNSRKNGGILFQDHGKRVKGWQI